MAKRVLKTRTQFTSTLEISRYDDLKQLSKDTSIPISRLLDMAVAALLEKKNEVGI